MSGKPDVGQIQMLLTDWEKKFRINTQTSTFVNVDVDENIIAYGTIDVNETSDYRAVVIPLKYRDMNRIPKYVVVVGAASKYGDYFHGGEGSILYIDDFSFEYGLPIVKE